mgnify:CR=1 FL=1
MRRRFVRGALPWAASCRLQLFPAHVHSSSSPLSSPHAQGDQCVSLEDCHTAAKLNNLTYFGIVDQVYCFGGKSLRKVQNTWATDR